MITQQPGTCPNCGHAPPTGSKYCNQCGVPLVQTDPNRIVWNIFTAWKGREYSVWKAVYAWPFESKHELINIIGDHTEHITVYCGSYVASQDGQMTIKVLSWQQITPEGTLGENEGAKTIQLTNLESFR